ncbi:hypothetical protein HYH02_011493 [Chlamydomonas schloesseri]|uniref:TauD/TfdA-like domain-containing protein n=1 Tax=Chlamydomonas schloesseri TaxID=2026947 RepID=A0A835W5M0_9CHLO|nr:hypothetical protein HYH02_011493 [Chlamydomonas schloesseri]|eukprot:KAG2436556.1 hypothetical protein HYH02_011493 [Chlamydomonas schloesseri]
MPSEVATTSRQGSVVPFTRIEGPDAWVAADFPELEEEMLHLTPEQIAEIDAAVDKVIASGKPLQEVSLADFELPTLSLPLIDLGQQAQHGRGWSLLRGVPVQRYSRQQQLTAWWILGLHWGRAVPQNAKGHLIGHIKDLGRDPADPNTRLYATNAAQPWHNDGPADLVGLLCLSDGAEGGESGWSSSVSVHNEILRTAPHLAHVLADSWFFDRKGEVPAGKKPFFEIPVFNYHKGYLSVNYSDNYYHLSQRHAEVPRLGPDHHAAMALFNQLASSPELSLRHILQPGDVQLLSNHTCLHYRGAFRDSPEHTRHLLRLWVSPPNDRPLPEVYSEIMGGSVVPGKRGGIFIQNADHNPIPLEAE